jgi:hypothetical protein
MPAGSARGRVRARRAWWMSARALDRAKALARRIDQPFVGHAVGHQHLRRHLEQVARQNQ